MTVCADQANRLQGEVVAAIDGGRSLNIAGSGSKSFTGRAPDPDLESLSVAEHAGITHYAPGELVLTARAGTPLAEIERALAEQGQMLGFEPPYFGKRATLGGAISAGLSGPRRPYAGAARDFVLGVTLINGRGEIVRFGGEVMKNVAGYDVSRLVTGAMGTLGVLLEISLKVLPRPEQEVTLAFDFTREAAVEQMNHWAGRPLPLSALCHDGRKLLMRLSGFGSAVTSAASALGGEVVEEGEAFWIALREQTLGFFQTDRPLWRISMPQGAPSPGTESTFGSGRWLIDWGGGLRWLVADVEPGRLRHALSSAQGQAWLFRNPGDVDEVLHPLSPTLLSLHRRIKEAMDPRGVFNPGRMYRDL